MRRRAFYSFNKKKCDNNIKETFGFKSRKYPGVHFRSYSIRKRFIRYVNIITISRCKRFTSILIN